MSRKKSIEVIAVLVRELREPGHIGGLDAYYGREPEGLARLEADAQMVREFTGLSMLQLVMAERDEQLCMLLDAACLNRESGMEPEWAAKEFVRLARVLGREDVAYRPSDSDAAQWFVSNHPQVEWLLF